MKNKYQTLTNKEAKIASNPFDLDGFVKELGSRVLNNREIVETGLRFGTLVTASPDFDESFTQQDVAGISTLESQVDRARALADKYDAALEALKGI